jgi:N-acetyl-anhydromuramyl-L-alanine amidase AmpD
MERTCFCAAQTAIAAVLLLAAGCIQKTSRPALASDPSPHARSDAAVNPIRPGQRLARQGDEIMVCGQLFHTNAPVVLWTDPGGYDAYRTERRFAPWHEASFQDTKDNVRYIEQPNRYNIRFAPPATQPSTQPATEPSTRPSGPLPPGATLTPDQFDQIRGGGWPLPLLQQKVDQFVYHYDVAGTSRTCFKVLHDMRGLSVHFMLDLDGTIYQTLDLKERAWHATTSNHRSIGIEIANMGAYPNPQTSALREWYSKDASGRTLITIPKRFNGGGIRTPNFTPRPARDELIWGTIHGRRYAQYDLTPQQYDSLIKLTATLCTIFPNLKCDYPRDESGNLLLTNLPDDQLATYQGLLGHFHVQRNKQDPGPAFQWDRVITGARALMQAR